MKPTSFTREIPGAAHMTAREYTDALTARLDPQFFRPIPSRAMWLPVYGATVALCTFAVVNGHPTAISKLVFSLVIGVAFSCLGILGHEILHGTVVERLWLRRFLAAFCLAPLGIGPNFWTIWHNTHHANTQHPVRDPDTWGAADGTPIDRAMGFLRHFANPRALIFPVLLLVGTTAHATALLFFMQPKLLSKQRLVTLAEFLAVWCFWFSLALWLGWINFLFFFAIPLLVANLIVNSFVITNHSLNPLDDDTGDPLAGSLTVNTFRWIEWLLLNFNYHTEHHLFPRMNPKHAPQVTKLLKEMWPDRYHRLPHRQALLAVWRTPRAYHDRVHLMDTRDHAIYGTLGHGFEGEQHRGEPADAH